MGGPPSSAGSDRLTRRRRNFDYIFVEEWYGQRFPFVYRGMGMGRGGGKPFGWVGSHLIDGMG